MRKMKNSGISWIGKIPEEWNVIKAKYIFLQRNERGNKKSLVLLSPTQKYGVIPQNLYEQKTGMSAVKLNEKTNLTLLKTIHKGDFCISLRSFQGGFEYSEYEGVVSPAYQVFFSIINIENRFYKYLFKDDSFIYKMNSYTMSLRDGKNIAFSDFGNTKIPFPPVLKQQKIADFLDYKCSKIDALIENLKARIEKTKEYKKAVITEAVTKGLNNDIKLKETDSQFWHEIPEYWQIVDIKYLFEIVKRIAGKEGYDILSVTQKGLKVKDISRNEGQIAANYSGYQFVYPTDFVMNHMDLLTGWVDCSTMFGVTSPDYRVFRLRNKKAYNIRYYTYIMQCCYSNRYFYSLGQGVSNLGRWRLQTPSFMNFQIPVPPLEEQKQIAEYLDSKCVDIDILLQNYENQITTLEEYKKSLIYEYVTGKKEVPEI